MFHTTNDIFGFHNLIDHLLQLVTVGAPRSKHLDFKTLRFFSLNGFPQVFPILPQESFGVFGLGLRGDVVLGLKLLQQVLGYFVI